jgi:murein DD-endopeptidase MepM/ murein hydrolase activator NlpD
VPPPADKAVIAESALPDNYAEPEGLIPLPPMLDLPADDDATDVAEAGRFLQLPNIMSFIRPDDNVDDDDLEVIKMTSYSPPAIPEQNEAGLVPFNPGGNLPVVTEASRQYKLLRSMAREVRGIRQSLSDIGLPETSLPELEELDQFVETADFAKLAMAVENHRSLLRKVPLKPPMLYFYISSNYGPRRHPVLETKRFHHGIDLAGTWQETVHAPAPGTVIYAGTKGSFGKVVQVRHAYGFVTTYAHLAKITVRQGADVVPGTVVGKMGRTGRVDGAHLHYEIRLGDKSIDPKKFFAIGHRIGVGGELMLATDQP